ncbi:Rattus norvegicus CLN2 is a lysosomal protease Precursor [Penicillium macrosclerotiorum]|uniref:Rattus norvegicus CLN2 is a lysosomal protease Precursor n=1 Tax=Penicillium macrosclerotiorum TaxID=303699 RepID=UPI0025468869|nr:Rattus norvegicus CLN2 is a lysosomal protease Precursor [Penicillium macrosclerotiorum]KAJ5689010.1 Rattus norvegicus CLN2 is a lysosomal protease Precursor [Penicillium macrosclerotiorum]
MSRTRVFFWVALATAVGTVAHALPPTHVIHEKRDWMFPEWKSVGRSKSDSLLQVRVGLKQNNLHRAGEYLLDVSHPQSSNYGKHWSADQVIDAFAPSDNTIILARSWLNESGISDVRISLTDNKGWLAFVATAKELEELLHTQYHQYQNSQTGQFVTACEKYHLPHSIQEHIDYIEPGIRLPASGQQQTLFRKRDNILIHGASGPMHLPDPDGPFALQSLGCEKLITPDCIRAMYKVPLATKAHPQNSLGIFQEDNYFHAEDLDSFFENQTTNIPQGTRPLVATIDNTGEDGGSSSKFGLESALDLQVAYPIVYPQTITVYQSYNHLDAQNSSRGFLDAFLNAIDGSNCNYCASKQCDDSKMADPESLFELDDKVSCGIYKPANVISISYGGPEQNFPAPYQRRQCNEYMKLGLQGVSVLFASGDNGVAGHDGCLGPRKDIFSPTFPANCPYITSVGGTKVLPEHTSYEPEIALHNSDGKSILSSGGGFSNVFPAPTYQEAAVSRYFSNSNPGYPFYEGNWTSGGSSGLYNRLGRGYPDVAAVADNIALWYEAKFGHTGGTSASTPIFAAIINRIVDERLAIGKGPIGFLNPVLYDNEWVLNDIVIGSNPGCGTQGFTAAVGWDPVTGLGTPNYEKMLHLFLSLP